MFTAEMIEQARNESLESAASRCEEQGIPLTKCICMQERLVQYFVDEIRREGITTALKPDHIPYLTALANALDSGAYWISFSVFSEQKGGDPEELFAALRKGNGVAAQRHMDTNNEEWDSLRRMCLAVSVGALRDFDRRIRQKEGANYNIDF